MRAYAERRHENVYTSFHTSDFGFGFVFAFRLGFGFSFGSSDTSGSFSSSRPFPRVGESSPRLRVAANNTYGVIFVGTFLFVVVVTNFILRGLASIIAVAGIVILVLLFALLHWWDSIFQWIGGLDIRMNAGGYLAISGPLFLLWLFSTYVYDHYTYLIIARGQARICAAIGDAETAIDATGLLLEKKRNDLFRHWLLGFGSGDLRVKTGGPANLDFELSNVLFIGGKLRRIQNLLREKEVAPQAATA